MNKEELEEAMKKIGYIRDALPTVVALRLPNDEIEQIQYALMKKMNGYPAEETAAISTLFGVVLKPCPFGRFAVLRDGSIAPLKPGTYEYDPVRAIAPLRFPFFIE